MSKPFEQNDEWKSLHDKIVGLGEQSSRKSYYPELQKRIQALEEEIERRHRIEKSLHYNAKMLEEEIAERQAAEESASMERDNARAVFESAPVGMMIINPQCRVIDVNLAMAKLCGRGQGELFNLVPGQVLDCAFTSSDNQECGHAPECSICKLREMVKSVVETRKGLYNTDLYHVRRIGTGKLDSWLKISMEPISFSGQPCAIIAVHDVTEQRSLENEILKTRKLESLGVLAGGIAHDFNNLLTGILGNISVAHNRSEGNPSVTTPLDRALQATERAAELTRQLLTFSKGGAPIKQLASLANIVKDSAEFALRGANVVSIFTTDDHLWSAEVDIGQISQVINNLVINADQAMPDGGSITISLNNKTLTSPDGILKAGRYIQIIVADKGNGIEPESLQKIFDPYFTTKESGNGLGLATVHSIITKHDGTIQVTSTIGEGTTFTILLPASEKDPLELQSIRSEPVIGKGKILVMDDEAMIRELAFDMLEMLGYTCEVCENGQCALDSYKKAMESNRPFDAVIMDLTVPGGMGGEETMKRILMIDPEAVGIVASGYSNDPILAVYKKYGFKAAIPKPFSLTQVADTLTRILD